MIIIIYLSHDGFYYGNIELYKCNMKIYYYGENYV